MHKILVPNDIQLVDPITRAPMRDATGLESKPIAFREFAVRSWLNSPAWPTGHVEMSRLATVILPRMIEAHAGTTVMLEDADHEKLAAVARAPLAGFGPLAAAQLLPFADAVLNATTEEATNGVSAQHAGRAPRSGRGASPE